MRLLSNVAFKTGFMLKMLCSHASFEPLLTTTPSSNPTLSSNSASLLASNSDLTSSASSASSSSKSDLELQLQPWQLLLLQAHQQSLVALIDAGALLAGINMISIADFMLELMKSTQRLGNLDALICSSMISTTDASSFKAGQGLQAVVYFDNSQNDWLVKNFAGRIWPLKSSPIDERDAFVIFDERHCRGADMKLRRHGRAMVTLGPKMNKDKLMQAAGRMRQLGEGQTLLLVAAQDVIDSIQSTTSHLPFNRTSPSSAEANSTTTSMGATSASSLSFSSTQPPWNPQILSALHWVMNNTIGNLNYFQKMCTKLID
jgi:hypothetical protein